MPKGPCLDPSEKRLAVQVEDHPLEYATFEGTIPEGEYGAGEVIVWDRGKWQPPDNPAAQLRRGKLEFELAGEKLQGGWRLVRMTGERSDGGKNWLLMKRRDDAARPLGRHDIVQERPESVKTGRRLEDLKAAPRKARRSSRHSSKGKPRGKGSKRAKQRSPSDPLPGSIDVQLATLASAAPTGPEWLHEIKFDGYRLVARIESGLVQLLTRNHLDWTDRYSAVAEALQEIPAESAILDGEVVAQLESGETSFQALQNALRDRASHKLVYYAFDLLYLDGRDLRSLPLQERKGKLQALLAEGAPPQIQFSGHFADDGQRFWEECCKRGLEGIVSKRRDKPYRAGRSEDWLKIKCVLREELVIGGFTISPAKHRDFGALLVGYFDDGRLTYAGRVGTGFDARTLAGLRRWLDQLETSRSPFAAVPAKERAGIVRWVQPRLIAQVDFGGWTNDGILRHPSFQGLREDKSPSEVHRPESLSLPAAPSTSRRRMKKKSSTRRQRSTKAAEHELPVRLTHPDRLLFPDMGLTKRDLVNYYTAVADWILPHLKGRPLSLLRCPEGQGKACFFQKHAAAGTPDALQRIDIEEKDETEEYLIANDLPGLLSLAQMSVLEIHPWGSRSDRLEHPDVLIFDLDPGEGVAWSEVVKAGVALRESLESIGLTTFAKLTGGKGLHLVAPLSPRRHDWDEVKSFARSVAEHFAAEQPRQFVATMSKARRRGKIFIDYLRNDRGATAIAPYSTRAKPGAPVACPIGWDELSARVHPNGFNVENLPKRLNSLASDPWDGFFDLKQPLPKFTE
ncbi:MAG TPA: DNA ligase D [Pirellulaceae bacterium]|nr:DNA ligase D [Pirellulaceae bacterium]